MLTTAKVWQCDICGWRWMFVEGRRPKRCADRNCQSRQWDSKWLVVLPPVEVKPQEVAGNDVASMERLREIVAGRNLDTFPPKKPPVAELPVNSFLGDPDPDPAGWLGPVPEACPYRELDRDSSEWVYCALPVHGPKIKHMPGRRESA